MVTTPEKFREFLGSNSFHKLIVGKREKWERADNGNFIEFNSDVKTITYNENDIFGVVNRAGLKFAFKLFFGLKLFGRN